MNNIYIQGSKYINYEAISKLDRQSWFFERANFVTAVVSFSIFLFGVIGGEIEALYVVLGFLNIGLIISKLWCLDANAGTTNPQHCTSKEKNKVITPQVFFEDKCCEYIISINNSTIKYNFKALVLVLGIIIIDHAGINVPSIAINLPSIAIAIFSCNAIFAHQAAVNKMLTLFIDNDWLKK